MMTVESAGEAASMQAQVQMIMMMVMPVVTADRQVGLVTKECEIHMRWLKRIWNDFTSDKLLDKCDGMYMITVHECEDYLGYAAGFSLSLCIDYHHYYE